MSQVDTRQVQLPPSLRSLTLSTTKLDKMMDYDQKISPVITSAVSYSGFLESTGGGKLAPEAMRSTEELGPVSLPPPPRRTPRRKKVPQYEQEEDQSSVSRLTIPQSRQSVASFDSSIVDQSPTMAWLQREGYSRGSIFTPAETITVVEEEGKAETTLTENNDKVAVAVSAARAALEEAAAADTDSSSSKLSLTASNANRRPVSVRLESSFEDIRVAEKQYFSTSKPRIIGIFIPPISPRSEERVKPGGTESPIRLPVDDRDDSLPPVATVGPDDNPTVVLPLATSPETHDGAWAPSHHVNFSSSTLPLRIEKKARKQTGDGTDSGSPSPTTPPTKEFIVPKGTAKSGRAVQEGTRGKLVKSKSTPAVEMQQIRAFMAGRDGASMPADHAWRHRPLISHAKSASRSSGCSMNSDTTYNPPSTIDPRDQPRISISSTIYPDTGLSAPNTADQPDFPPFSPDTDHFNNDSSEEDDYEYEPYPRNDILNEIQAEQIIDGDNYQLMSILSGTNILQTRSRSRSPKPPVPRTPKPIFSRKPLSEESSPSQSPIPTSLIFEGYQSSDNFEPPPTTNLLGQEERADLIRKSRKLARVFGRTPGPDVMAYQDGSRTVSQLIAAKHRHQRTLLSLSNDIDNTSGLRKRRASAWPSPTDSHFSMNSESRRHSAPLSPDEISFLNVSSPLYDASLSQVASQFRCESAATGATSGLSYDAHGSSNDQHSVTHHESDPNTATRNGASSPSHTSFIDWSEEEGPDDGLSIISQDPPKGGGGGVRRPTSPTHSFFENMTPEEQAEEDKRRKREKLAKLHRFLGSTVPVNLVVGPDSDIMTSQPSRPPTATSTSTGSGGGKTGSDLEDASRKAWIRRRRSSSAAAIPSNWSDDIDRMKEELNTQEKLINVRRAQKMEKVFGVAPPQTLYHTRGHTPSPSLPSLAPIASKTLGNPSAFIPAADAMYFTRNVNRSAYEKPSSHKLSRRRTNGRPSTAESSRQLIPKGRRSSSTTSFNFGSIPSSSSPPFRYDYDTNDVPKRSSPNRSSLQASSRNPIGGTSFNQGQGLASAASNMIYNHYQHSLNSLNDILDRDDRESLVELHHYLNSDSHEPENQDSILISSEQDDIPASTLLFERRPSDASVAAERRRSLPTKSASSTSLASEHTVGEEVPSTPKAELTDFQMRRRRAAKLTQFFGVQYRELINDVLDSLENGLEHEQKRGTLQASEIADLLERLRELKVKREGIPA